MNISQADNNAIATLLASDNRKMVIRELLMQYASLSTECTNSLILMIPDVVAIENDRQAKINRCHHEAIEAVKHLHSVNGSLPKTCSKYEMLAYMISEGNFYEWYIHYQVDPSRYRMVTAKRMCENDPTAEYYVRQLIDYLNNGRYDDDVRDAEGDSLRIQPSSWFASAEKTLPGVRDFLYWCKINQDIWNDLNSKES